MSSFGLELVFPGRILYHLICFSLSYPHANAYRKFVVCAMLTFGDFLFTTLVLGEDFPAVAKIMVLQYLVLFIVVHNLKIKQVYDEFKNSYYRTAIFLVEAYIKSTTLASTVHYLYGAEPDLNRAALAFALILGKCLVTPVVYFLDSFFCVRIPLAQVSTRELKSQFKAGLLVGLVLLAAAFVTGEVKGDYYFFSGLSYPKGIANVYFILLYILESTEYNRFFKI
mmetsp:Transcript_24264/g.43175  ORF Transcript_24264/g.43175 Transcript_24264/m.43175 type:complete len:225 (+) Transcript_24264:1327-2001(+)